MYFYAHICQHIPSELHLCDMVTEQTLSWKDSILTISYYRHVGLFIWAITLSLPCVQ